MSDIAWVSLKNIVLIISTVAGVYYISPWMFTMLLLYTTVSKGEDQ